MQGPLRGRGLMPYFANVGPLTGPVKYRDLPTGSIDVLEAMDKPMTNCSICAALHKATDPHDAQSAFYQTQFFRIHGRWPTWADAIAHCDPETRSIWESKLRGFGVWTHPPWVLQAA